MHKQRPLCLPMLCIGVSVCQEEMARAPLKGPMNKIAFAATYPGFWQREGRVDQSHKRRVWGLVSLGR